MKKITLILAVFIVAGMNKANAQIPNGGFESLSGWSTGNATLSTDHYPESVGNYSVKLENQLPLVNNQSYGYAVSGNVNNGCIPSFPISGHPNQLCGYYKCFPLNSDTVQIALMLFDNGVWVAGAELTTTNTVSNWTAFSIPISPYTTADSATITVAAFYNDSTCSFPYGPFGNSILYVDNLGFDSLITSVSEIESSTPKLILYPNPASEVVTLNFENYPADMMTISIYDVSGALVKTAQINTKQPQINVSDLDNGVYFVNGASKALSAKQKLIIHRH